MLSARSRLKDLTESDGDNDGILFADSPGEKVALEKAKRERRRRKIVKELFQTEKAYLNHLDLIHKYFYFPLRFNCILPEEAHARLFSNVEQIKDVNRTLLELMEQSTVGQAFRHLGPFLKLYSMYANNHQQALAVLQDWTQKSSEFAEFLQTQEARPELMGLKINSLLITPVQRVPRYKMLLEDLLENTPRDHHDYSQLQEATKQIGDIAQHINEHIRQHENFQKMLSIQKSFDSSAPKILQPGRIFLKEGPLKKVSALDKLPAPTHVKGYDQHVSRKGAKFFERMFFLFNDVLLYGKPRLVESGGRCYSCCCLLPVKQSAPTVSRKGAKSFERMFFLFNDVLLYGKPRLVESGGRCYSCCCVLPVKHCKLDNVFVTSAKQSHSSGGGVFKITCKEESLVLYSDDTGAAEAWSKAIDRAIRKANDDRLTLRKPSSNKIPLRGRSLRKHRQQQKKSANQVTPVRRKPPKADDDECCSPQMRQRTEPFRERIMSLYDNLPGACASPPHPGLESALEGAENNRFSIICEDGESLSPGEASSSVSGGASYRGSVLMEDSAENYDSFAVEEDLSSLAGSVSYNSSRLGAEGANNASFSSLGSVVYTATGTEIYYPRGSTRTLNKPHTSVRAKIKSYLRRPFTRLQKARQNLTGHCSPFTQRCSEANPMSSLRRK